MSLQRTVVLSTPGTAARPAERQGAPKDGGGCREAGVSRPWVLSGGGDQGTHSVVLRLGEGEGGERHPCGEDVSRVGLSSGIAMHYRLPRFQFSTFSCRQGTRSDARGAILRPCPSGRSGMTRSQAPVCASRPCLPCPALNSDDSTMSLRGA